MDKIAITDAADLVRELREIAWSDERQPGDDTGRRADSALRAFANRYPHLLKEFDFQELREYLEQQDDDAAKAILATA